MSPVSADLLIKIGLGVVVLGAAYWGLKKIGGAAGAAFDAAGAAVSDAARTVDQYAAAPVVAIGESVGIPQTNISACTAAIAEGRTFDASFACDAGTFLKYLTAPKPSLESLPRSAYWKS